MNDDIEDVLRTASRVALVIDQECLATDFWHTVYMQRAPNEIAARLRDMVLGEPLYVSPDEARTILAWAITLPEWDADDAPEYAPHPILVQESEDEGR